MSSDSNYIVDFLSKLNHPIEDVRSRALRNISNKIERRIIDMNDLCSYNVFIPYLLEWFNNDVVNHQDLVLKLIKVASGTVAGASQLLRVGGVDFLGQLRENTRSPELLKLLDDILDNIFKNCGAVPITSVNNIVSCMYTPKKIRVEKDSVTNEDEYHQTIGYFSNSFSSLLNNNLSQPSQGYDPDQDEAFKLSIHPIIPLTTADKKVLGGSLGTLRSDDFRVVTSGIQFFTDVILEDFPAPVFLQRQGAIKILMQFLNDRQYTLSAAKALLKLSQKLIVYLETCLDPNFFSTKNTFGIIKQESGGYEEECPWMCNDLMDLQYEPNTSMPSQMPVPVFALQTITTLLLQFLELDTDINWVEYFQLLFTAFRLLRSSLGGDLRRPSLWDPWNITELLSNQFELWSKLLAQYSVREDVECQRQFHDKQIYLGLFAVFWELVTGFYSPEIALKNLPTSTKTELSRALLNCSLCLGMGSKLDSLILYVQLFDQNVVKVHTQSLNVMHSAESLIKFFLHNNEPIKYAEICITAATESLECLDHLYGPRFCKEFVHFFSIICSTEVFFEREDMFMTCDNIMTLIFKSPSSNLCKLAIAEIFDIVKTNLSIDELAKPKSLSDRKINFVLRTNVFKSLIIYGLYNKSPEVLETSATLFCRIWDSQRMISASNWRKVEDLTGEHMTLLQPLADTSNRIGRQIMALSFTAIGTKDNKNVRSQLINILPLCYNRKTDVRKEASQQLEQLIRKDRTWNCQVNINSMTDFLVLSDSDNKHDRWFTTRSSSHIKSMDLEIENFRKVFDIYLSNNVDICVRKSAAEQLGIFLQMPNMHAYFINHGGLHFVLDLIKGQSLEKSQMSILMPSTVLIVLRIVQHKSDIRDTLIRDSELIDNLFQMALYFCYDKQFLADVSTIFALLLFNGVIKQEKHGFDLAIPDILIQRLIFPFRTSEYKVIELPQSSSLLLDISSLPNQKWSYKDSFECFLRINWTILKHGGLENYISHKHSVYGRKVTSTEDNSDLLEGILESSDKLLLTEYDIYLLNNSLPQMILCDNLQKIDNATNHCQVQQSLMSVQLMITLAQYKSVSVNCHNLFHDSSLWLSSIKKFLLNIPSCSADYTLLELTMDVFSSIMKLPLANEPVDDFVRWIMHIMMAPNNSLLYSLQKGDQIIGKTDSRRLTIAKNKLELRLPAFFALVLRYLNVNLGNLSPSDHAIHDDITHVHSTIFGLALQRLRMYMASPFDNLSMLLHWVVLMSACLEMKCELAKEVTQEIVANCCAMCSDLIIKFQNNRDEGSITFMGTAVILYLLKILIRLLCDRLETDVDQSAWLRKSPWLLELVGYRSVEIRALSVALINKLVQFDTCRTILFKHCSELLPESLWHVSLTLFCDNSEAAIVRCQALSVLHNLCAKIPLNNSLEIAFDENSRHLIDKCTPVFVDHDSCTQHLGIEALHRILLSHDFFRKVAVILTNFYTFPLINGAYLRHNPLYDPEQNVSALRADIVQLNVNRTLQQAQMSVAMNISTPLLVSSLMSFMCNLCCYLPTQMSSQFSQLRMNTLIMNLLDPKLLHFYLQSTNKQHISTTLDLISSYMYSVRLIRLQISMDSHIGDSFLMDEKFMVTVIQLLIATNSDMNAAKLNIWIELFEYQKYVTQFQIEIITLLISMVIPVPSNDHVQLIITHLSSHVDGIFTCIRNMCLSKSKKANVIAMQFLSLFVSLNFKDSKPSSLVSSLENQKFPNSDLVMVEDLIEILLKRREKCSNMVAAAKSCSETSSNERVTAHNTLKILLGVSKTGKNYLLKVGFIDSAMVEMRYIHTKLDQCGQNKSVAWKSLMKELISVLELLQNLFYDDVNAQNIGISVGFPNTIYRLWTLALIDSDLMHSVLSCLMNFCADSSRSSKALVNCHQSVSFNDQPAIVGCNISLIENLCRLTSADVNGLNLREVTVRLVFRLLANLVWCPEAVNYLLRSKFLDRYEKINPNLLQKSSAGIHIQNLWIGLLTSLSFTEEGQSALMKINGAAIIRVLLLQNQILSFRSSTMLILRNLCTHPVIKVKLVVDGSGLIDSVTQCLCSNNHFTRQLALSSLKALLYSNKKIRSYLKSANVVTKLSTLRDDFESDSKSSLLPDIITLLNVFQDGQEFRAK